jgi:hypothetical protein
MSRFIGLLSLLILGVSLTAGCTLLPETARRPAVHNPFPQLSSVAVVEFFNRTSDDSVVDGFAIAEAYASELQVVPGFDVVPPDVVRAQLVDLRLIPDDLNDPAQRRRVCEALKVDALVIGNVTEYSPYYPPRIGLKVGWFTANPCFHPIPPGYGLPWGTPAAEEIPDEVLFEAEMALAREQLKTQTPENRLDPARDDAQAVPAAHEAPATGQTGPSDSGPEAGAITAAQAAKVAATASAAAPQAEELPVNWPDPRGFIPPRPQAQPPVPVESGRAVMSHIKVFNGHDAQFTAALRNYYFFRDEARFGGWQSYLQRSDDFIRFCCHLHIAEMLSLRGGSSQSRLVWRWPQDR